MIIMSCFFHKFCHNDIFLNDIAGEMFRNYVIVDGCILVYSGAAKYYQQVSA